MKPLPQPPMLPRIRDQKDIEAAFKVILDYLASLRSAIEAQLP